MKNFRLLSHDYIPNLEFTQGTNKLQTIYYIYHFTFTFTSILPRLPIKNIIPQKSIGKSKLLNQGIIDERQHIIHEKLLNLPLNLTNHYQ